ncbi:putative peptidyl-tRNA hydrolase PTRHD1 isoform X2 [Montipora capricornis]|uniref:putative peptidyl-tRNA hydrolase PTRHD1 isoform X2 n=1 Tax=Montipora capricornis TaxID=246305 RepID=UPI0035F111A2
MSLTSTQLVQYVVVRGDLLRLLSWPTGAVIAQACHASTAALWSHRNDPNTIKYTSELDNMRKVVLEVWPASSGERKAPLDFMLDVKISPQSRGTCKAIKGFIR